MKRFPQGLWMYIYRIFERWNWKRKGMTATIITLTSTPNLESISKNLDNISQNLDTAKRNLNQELTKTL